MTQKQSWVAIFASFMAKKISMIYMLFQIERVKKLEKLKIFKKKWFSYYIKQPFYIYKKIIERWCGG